MLKRFFDLEGHKTNIRTEVLAGVTTFLTMAYILAVNPEILSKAGMDKDAVFTATALSAFIGTLVMALWAKLPFALAPGMGLNAFFAFTVVLTMGYSWQFALTAVFIEGILFLLLTAFNIRELIVDSIPLNMKHAVSAGIGLFIAFIGLQHAGLVVSSPATMLTLGDIKSPMALVAVVGILTTGVLFYFRVKGALLIGILASTFVGIPLGVTLWPSDSHLVSLPPSIEPIFFKFDFSHMFTMDMLIVVFTFLFVDVFDSVGTLVGVSSKAGMLDKDGRVPRVKQALFADAIGTTVGAAIGTSTVVTYVESASGVAEGGRSGLTSLTVAILFVFALFFAPLFTMIPGAATAPALILVGLFMLEPIKNIDFGDFTEAIPAFFTIIMMPLCYSIAEGIVFGMLSYVLLKVLTGQFKKLSVTMIVIALLFILKFFMQ
jgi:AGZA family xanthine/uracil permease-like MFS transporter